VIAWNQVVIDWGNTLKVTFTLSASGKELRSGGAIRKLMK